MSMSGTIDIEYILNLPTNTEIADSYNSGVHLIHTSVPGLGILHGNEQEIVTKVRNWYDKLSDLEKIVYNIEIIPDKV